MRCDPYFKVARRVLPPADSLTRVVRWVTEFPLYTAEAVFAMTFPNVPQWVLEADDFIPQVAQDAKIYDTLIFRAQPDASAATASDLRADTISVIIQPPWILSIQDLETFVDCSTLRRPNGSGDTIEYNSAELLWAKVWDTCVRAQTRWFILTSYEGWVLGTFSRGHSSAFVSSVIKGGSSAPTVVEALVYWLASAASIGGAWAIPEVIERAQNMNIAVTVADAPAIIHKVTYSPSESEWDARSMTSMSDAASEESLEVLDILMCPTAQNTLGPLSRIDPQGMGWLRHGSVDNVMAWQMGRPYHDMDDPNTSVNVQAPPSEVSSASSASTVVDHSTDLARRWGFWQVG